MQVSQFRVRMQFDLIFPIFYLQHRKSSTLFFLFAIFSPIYWDLYLWVFSRFQRAFLDFSFSLYSWHMQKICRFRLDACFWNILFLYMILLFVYYAQNFCLLRSIILSKQHNQQHPYSLTLCLSQPVDRPFLNRPKLQLILSVFLEFHGVFHHHQLVLVLFPLVGHYTI